MNKDQKKELHEAMIALFLFMLKYSNKISPLLKVFKSNRNIIKEKVNQIYLKYTKNNEFKMTTSDINEELKNLEPIFKKVGNDLVNQEDKLLKSLLYLVYAETYNRTFYIMSKGIADLELKKLTDSIINKSIKKKIQDKTAFDRNKDNKTKLINKVSRDIKTQLSKGSSIEVIQKNIDENFNTGASYSQRLIENEIAINFNAAQMEAYRNANIELVEFSAVLDERTTPLCESLDGNIYNLDIAPIPPLHVNCRSELIPILINWNDSASPTWGKYKSRNNI